MVTQFQFEDMKSSLPCVFIPYFVIYLSAISICKQTDGTCILDIVTSKNVDHSYGQTLVYIPKLHEARKLMAWCVYTGNT